MLFLFGKICYNLVDDKSFFIIKMSREKPLFAEEISIEAGKEKFSAKQALETPGFFEFVSKYAPEKAEALDEKEMEKLFGAFQATKETTKFYQETLQQETGLSFAQAEVQPALEAYFVSKKESPAYLRTIVEVVQEYRKLQDEISSREASLMRLGGEERIKEELEKKGKPLLEKKEVFKRKKAIKETMTGLRGFFNLKNSELIGWMFRNEEESLARSKSLEYWQKQVEEITPEAEKYEKIEEALKKLEEQREQAVNFKSAFFDSRVEPVKEIMAMTREKIVEKLQGLADPKQTDMRKINEGLELVQKLGTSDLGIMETKQLSKFEEKFDQLIKKKAADHLNEQIKKLEIGPSALGYLERKINQYLREELVLKDKERAKRHIRKRLETYLKRTIPPKGETKESFRAKKIAIKCLLFKLA